MLALRLELVRAHQAAEDYCSSLCASVRLCVCASVILVRHRQHQGQRISASMDIGGVA